MKLNLLRIAVIFGISLTLISCRNATRSGEEHLHLTNEIKVILDSLNQLQTASLYEQSSRLIYDQFKHLDKKEGEFSYRLISNCNAITILLFLEKMNYIKTVDSNTYSFNFKTFSNYNSSTIEILQATLKKGSPSSYFQPFIDGLTITGSNLMNLEERNRYIKNNILKTNDQAIGELLFLSNYLKIQTEQYFPEQAMREIIRLADAKTLIGFFKQSGAIEFSSRNDEYQKYKFENLAHLPKPIIQEFLLAIEDKQDKPQHFDKNIEVQLRKLLTKTPVF